MVALHHWNPEVNHAILLFCPFYFRMAMRASREIAIISARTFAAAYFPYLSFFLYLGLIPTRIISQLLALTPAVLFILFAGLSPRGMTVFFGSFLLINLWIIRGVHSINDVLRDLIAECSHMLP